ncbi:phospholipase A and acyltransferase 2-like isoform X1 [Scyliorhinus canicula]|uniref:phospholipase A and acyltransferase 2-like isoform X1 n=1 Tax=Scyliorhinus canicula TaxID=7830 RepID=UPI0018F6DCCE|nr:phospholipase A and acyltransferase 2-like isoform X1 [Scyliorhinus canicula]
MAGSSAEADKYNSNCCLKVLQLRLSLAVVLKYLGFCRPSILQAGTRCCRQDLLKMVAGHGHAICGDLVEFNYGPFQHWAIYVGGDKIVHLTVPESQERSRWSRVFPSSGYIVCLRTQVRLQSVWEVRGQPEVRVWNETHDRLLGNPDAWERIEGRIVRLLNRQFTYSLFTFNCEHLATFLRYGVSLCSQVSLAMSETAAVKLRRACGEYRRREKNSRG